MKSRNNNVDKEKILNLYLSIDKKQQDVMALQALYIKPQKRYARFDTLDLRSQIDECKMDVIEYNYNLGLENISKQDRFSMRAAYNNFLKVEKLDMNYNQVQSLIEKALREGQNYVLLNIEPSRKHLLPWDLEQNIQKINNLELNDLWTKFDIVETENTHYTHLIKLQLQNVDLSPELLSNKDFWEEKQIVEKVFQKDSNNRILKDSLGKEIFKMITKTIRCKVSQTTQSKSAIVNGYLEIFNIETNQIVKAIPVSGSMTWQNVYANSYGDKNALSESSKQLVCKDYKPFPSNFIMLSNACENYKFNFKNALKYNINLLR